MTNISAGDYIKVRNVDFGETGAQSFTARVRTESTGILNIRVGSKSSIVKGKLTIESTNGEWADVTCELSSAITGVRDLFFTFQGKGSSLFDFDSWHFDQTDGITELTSDEATTPRLLNGKYFDLSGRSIRLSAPSQVIRIINGRKIIIR